MKRLFYAVFSICIVLCVATGSTRADDTGSQASGNWAHWRGPLGTGVAPDSNPPLHFSLTKNIKWKFEDPGLGYSTPIIWGDKIFLTTSIRGESITVDQSSSPGHRAMRRARLFSQRLVVMCIDKNTGKMIWQQTAAEVNPHEGVHRSLSSYANESPVTDGEYIYAHFGSLGLFCYDFDGNLKWKRDFEVVPRIYNTFGESSSPALLGNTIVVQFDHEDQSFVEAVDKRTGETIWKKLRDEETSWSSPLAFEHDGKAQVVLHAGNFLTSYDLASGEVLWTYGGSETHPVPIPIYRDGIMVITSGTGGKKATSVLRLGKSGELAGSDSVLWTTKKGSSYNPTPLLWGDELYIVNDGGFIPNKSGKMGCFDAMTGAQHYFEQRFSGSYTIKSSPIGAGGDRIYIATEEGDVIVLARGKQYKELAVNDMGEQFLATPVIIGNEIFLRGQKHLFCISEDGA